MESIEIDYQPCEKTIIEILESHKRPITIGSLRKQAAKKDTMFEYEFRFSLMHLLADGTVKMVGNSRRLILHSKMKVL